MLFAVIILLPKRAVGSKFDAISLLLTGASWSTECTTAPPHTRTSKQHTNTNTELAEAS